MRLFKSFELNLYAPLLGMAILTLGNGYFSTLTTLELNAMQYSVWAVGWVSTLYYAGMIVGSYLAQNLIVKMEHRKAYLVFALSLALAAVLQGLYPSVWLWSITRFISAFCLAGLFIVIESWLIAGVPYQYKGQIMAIYLLAYYIFQALSQLLLKIKFTEYWMAYILIASLAGLSIIPVMLAKKTAPITEHNKFISPKLFLRKAPFGVSAAVVAGLMFPMIYTMYPLLLAESGLNASQIADVMSVTLIGGALLQLPIGKISDRFDRRKILIALSIGTAVTGLLMAVSYQYYGLMLILSFILGGLVFGIYPVSV
ncbi:MAG: transporter, partial [Gammaproteobacteria bacterium]|nr:transporter [Gammaproteobacteria bacterium]